MRNVYKTSFLQSLITGQIQQLFNIPVKRSLWISVQEVEEQKPNFSFSNPWR